MDRKTYRKVAGIIFILVALFHRPSRLGQS
jgi:hypothetical protein